MSLRVLVVCGSSREDSNLRALTSLAASTARDAGADVELLDLHTQALPVMVHGDTSQDALPEVRHVRASAAAADAFIIGTPEYHGSMSGALKNWFDFLYPELAGKVAGVLASTGGGTGDMSITAVKTCFSWCHGFTLPFHAAAAHQDYAGGALVNEKVADRVRRVAFDVVRYAAAVRPAYLAALEDDPGPKSGMAGHHR